MQIAACQPVSFCLEYNVRQTSTLSRVTPVHPQFPAVRFVPLGTRPPHKRTWSGANDGYGRSSIGIVGRRS